MELEPSILEHPKKFHVSSWVRKETPEEDSRIHWLKFLSLKVFGLLSSSLLLFSPTFRLIRPPAFFRCLSNSVTTTELRTMSFTESTGVACSDFINYNQVQVLSIPVLLLACSQDWTCNLQMIFSLEA